jgi:adenylate kinase
LLEEISVTLIVNLFGAPGAGKSTTRADVFRRLKQAGVNAEEVYEHAKKLTWSSRSEELRCQPYIFGKQLRDMEILMGKVDVIITDSPLILCDYYTQKYRPDAYPPALSTLIVQQFQAMGGLNFFIERVNPYQQAGRNQSEAESDEVGRQLQELLDGYGVRYGVVSGDPSAGALIAQSIMTVLEEQKAPKFL